MRCLISVFNKLNLIPFAKFLVDKNVEIVSTGGTYQTLSEFNITNISNVTHFPEILNGRVKTLHPRIHGGLLAKRSNEDHLKELDNHDIKPIDIVVVNLYPFKQAILEKPYDEDFALENIDIGGHTLIRAAAKNYHNVLIITDPDDYHKVMNNWDDIDLEMKRTFAQKAFRHVTMYDMAISEYFNPMDVANYYVPIKKLKYGINPQQKLAGLYTNINKQHPFTYLNGEPGYINILDAIYSWNLVSELHTILGTPCAASYKHNSPAGVATSVPLTTKLMRAFLINKTLSLTPTATAYIRARNVDPMCSFGDFIAISGTVDKETANLIRLDVSDGIIAHDYHPEALDILKKKKGGRYVIIKAIRPKRCQKLEIRDMHDVVLIQEENTKTLNYDFFINSDIPKDKQRDLILAYTTLKYTQSNSVASAKDGQVLGVGAGQQSRIDCTKLVKYKTQNWYLRQHPQCMDLLSLFKKGVKRTTKINAIMKYINDDFTEGEWTQLFDIVPEKLDRKRFLSYLTDVSLASDAFFPFRDNIDVASQFGVKYIIQPGGSIADKEIMKVCDDYQIKMFMTGSDMRMFLH